MLCRLDLVSTDQVTHYEMAVIWPRSNNMEIRSTEGCRVEIRSMEDCRVGIRYTKVCRSTVPHKHGGTTWNYDLWKAVDIQKALYLLKTENNTELLLKLFNDSS